MDKPNILFLLSDEHSFRFMGHMPTEEGGEADIETPNLDRLAEQGTVFTDSYCQMPLCTPSRISILCGKEAGNCGAWSNCSHIFPEINTIPRTFSAAGYETCLVGKMHLGGSNQFVGFKHRPYGDLTGRTGHQWEPIPNPARGIRDRTTTAVGETGIPESLMQEEVVAMESISWLREQRHASPDQPWFLCASFSRPHFPLTAPKRWIDRYPVDKISEPKVPAAGDTYDHPMSVGMREGFMIDDINHEEMMEARAAYFACVSYLDQILGDMLMRLEADNLLDNTIIVYTTDHGELAGEHGMFWKNAWFEGCTRVPLIISTPEQRSGQSEPCKTNTPVALMDLYPTLCSLAGIDYPQDLDGKDISPATNGEEIDKLRPIPCDALNPRWGKGTEFRSIRMGDYKYVVFRDHAPLFFNLKEDPEEQINLIEKGIPESSKTVYEKLKQGADNFDFDQMEERYEKDKKRYSEFKQDLPDSTGNLYLLKSGNLVNADDTLYNPTVIAEDPSKAFSDKLF